MPAALHGKDTGKLTNPKELLRDKLAAPQYRESDSFDVIAAARKLSLLWMGPTGSNHSYAEFVDDLGQWA